MWRGLRGNLRAGALLAIAAYAVDVPVAFASGDGNTTLSIGAEAVSAVASVLPPVRAPIRDDVGMVLAPWAGETVIELPELSPDGDVSSFYGPDFQSRLTGFAQCTGRTTDVRHGVWLKQVEGSTKGLGFRLHPLAGAGRGLAVETAYLDRGPASTGSAASSARDDVWSVALSNAFLGNRLQVHSEFAASRRVSGGRGSAKRPDDGSAYNLLARYDGDRRTVADHSLSWNVALNREQVDPTFWTPADDAISRGELVDRLTARVGWGRLKTRLSYAVGNDHAEEDSRWRRRVVDAGVEYSALDPTWLGSAGWLLSAPRYRVSAKRVRHSFLELDDTTPDSTTDTAEFTADFTPGPWSWQVAQAHSFAYTTDGNEALSENSRTRLKLELPVNDRLHLKPELNWGMQRDYAADTRTHRLGGALRSSATIIRDRLNARFAVTANRRYRREDRFEQQTIGMESHLDWTIPLKGDRAPEVSLSLDGRYEYRSDTSDAEAVTNRYRAMANLKLSWPDDG
ncbi:MAG: hypothetical protein PVH31_04370 [Ectothiorhodospiraceae bacterium]|jgi:hypothetical protein